MSFKRKPRADDRETSFSADRSELLDNLWRAQNKHRYIRREDIEACSRALNISKVEVEGVVSFYHFSRGSPRARSPSI